MIGGNIKEILDCGNTLWISVHDPLCVEGDYCAIYVVKDDKTSDIKLGDWIAWQRKDVLWTPKEYINCTDRALYGIKFSIELQRLGYGGSKHPGQKIIESEYGEEYD